MAMVFTRQLQAACEACVFKSCLDIRYGPRKEETERRGSTLTIARPLKIMEHVGGIKVGSGRLDETPLAVESRGSKAPALLVGRLGTRVMSGRHGVQCEGLHMCA